MKESESSINRGFKVPDEILAKVKLLELRTRKLVNNVFSGEYKTAYRGQGMTFAEFREYVPGDDVRAISWSLTARTGKTYLKKFDEERELSTYLVVDISGSNDFGTLNLKSDVVVQISALLSLVAAQNRDHVGLLMYTDRVEHFVPAKKGRGHVHRILRDLFFLKPKSRKTNLKVAIDHLQTYLKKKSTIFILSDFMDQGYSQSLKMLGRKHDVLAIVIEDPMDQELPNVGLIDVEDPETGEIGLVDTGSASVRAEYKRQRKEKQAVREKLLRSSQVDQILTSTNDDFVKPIINYFRSRRK